MTSVRRYTVAVAALLVVVWTFAFTWEWSFIDDVGLKVSANAVLEREGVAGLWTAIKGQAEADQTWGLFRPLWYVYAVVFYLVNPAVGHGLRLAMLFVILLVPALRYGRRPVSFVVILSVLAANVTLYLGLSYLSLQELSGLALVALGLVSDGRIRRSLLWLGAAWFKTPFVWLFMAWSVWLLLQRRWWAAVNIVAGIATVAAAAAAARRGTYTQGFDLANLKLGIESAIPLFFWPGVVGLVGVAALRPKWKTIAWRDPLAWVLIVGGALYMANLLPWGRAGSYYGAPPIWMMSLGVLLMIVQAEESPVRHAKIITAVALLVVVGASARVANKLTRQQVDRNSAVVGVRQWAETVPPGDLIGVNHEEGGIRLGELMTLHGSPRTVKWVPDTDTEQRPKYYVYFHDQSSGNPRLQKELIKRYRAASIWRAE